MKSYAIEIREITEARVQVIFKLKSDCSENLIIEAIEAIAEIAIIAEKNFLAELIEEPLNEEEPLGTIIYFTCTFYTEEDKNEFEELMFESFL